MSEINPQLAAEYIQKNAARYAQAKAERVYLEEFRKSKKAMLMLVSDGKAVADREAYAYAHDEYLEVLAGLKAATEIEEKLKWDLISAQAKIEIWRTQQANNRATDKAMR